MDGIKARKFAIYGAGGFGKEVKAMLEMRPGYQFAGFMDDFKQLPLIEDTDYDDALVAVANPVLRKSIVERWNRKNIPFQSLVAGDVMLHPSIQIASGCIVCAGVKLTVDISINKFVIINLNCTVGHDVSVGDFASLMPGVNISGNVKIGSGVFIGSGATVLQGVTIGDEAIVGAGAVVLHDVTPRSTVVGVPARIVKQR